MCGNFSNDIPGAMGYSGHDTPISCVTNGHVDGLTSNGVTLNFRTYWDGDLCEESFNGVACATAMVPSTNTARGPSGPLTTPSQQRY
jgi:hypothetical protein